MNTSDILQTLKRKVEILDQRVAQEIATVGYVTKGTRLALQAFLYSTRTWPFRVKKETIVDDENLVLEPVIPHPFSDPTSTDHRAISPDDALTLDCRISDVRKTMNKENPLDLGS